MVNEILFWLLAAFALLGGIGLITSRSPIYCVLYAIVSFFCLAGLFLTLGAEFLAVIQIIVYAGAIMVLFLFVIMLLNLSEEDMEARDMTTGRAFAYILGLVFLAELLYAFGSFPELGIAYTGPFTGKVEPLGEQLLTQYLFPFEMISVVLLAALMGAMAIAKKHKA
ncbi:MAG: NADH-quinone oxidoreductase subunit J [Bacteroidetes bacterium]|nr:NADH-quinone oxidoreductase subunit J [Bacteroidota bacterium]